MKKLLPVCCAVFVCFSVQTFAQIPTNVHVQIVRAEDERRFDRTLEDLMKSKDERIRTRAALAAGRIGDEKAISALANLLENDSENVRSMAAFALGEIESVKAAAAILQILQNPNAAPQVRARAVEAAGKIAAANAKDAKAAELGKAILDVLETETKKPKPDRLTVLLGLTAVLRAKPEQGDLVAAKFLTNADARVRADAANTLTRIRAKNANAPLRAMLIGDGDAIARANAARALGAAEDADAFDALLKAAATDQDSRVRVSAIRSLAALKNAKAADKLLERAETLLDARTKSKSANPNEKSELLEIATTLGRILPNSNDERAIRFLQSFRESDKYRSPETEIAFARVSPKLYLSSNSLSKINYDAVKNKINADWRAVGSIAQGLGEIANLEATEETRKLREQSAAALLLIIENPFEMKDYETAFSLAMPDVLRAYAQFKSDNLAEVLRAQMKAKDAIVRATAVELLAGLPPEQTRFGDFEDSFRIALEDEKLDDALLATIEAIGKQKNERAADFLKDRLYYLAKLNPKYGSSKYLARRRIIALLKEKGTGDFSDQLGKTDSIFAQNDYVRAVTRKTPSAILKTEKGTFTIEFFPKEAPLTVDNFIKLANAKYFDGLTIHRVVPNFVMQDGDPRGDGNGGPGWQIRDEINMLPYERGAVGMALSGKDTGGSQWFVTHAPQPHLDGGYTVFGQVNETGMKVVDSLTRGDKILSVKIVEGKLTPKSGKR